MEAFRALAARAAAGDLEATRRLLAEFEVAAAEAATGGSDAGDGRSTPDDRGWMELLAASGVNRALLRVAERVGFATFMEVWSALSDEELLDERRRVHVPLMESTLLRYQRAKLIQAMGRRGMKPRQIIGALPPSLRGHLSRRTVVRILTGK